MLVHYSATVWYLLFDSKQICASHHIYNITIFIYNYNHRSLDFNFFYENHHTCIYIYCKYQTKACYIFSYLILSFYSGISSSKFINKRHKRTFSLGAFCKGVLKGLQNFSRKMMNTVLNGNLQIYLCSNIHVHNNFEICQHIGVIHSDDVKWFLWCLLKEGVQLLFVCIFFVNRLSSGKTIKKCF